MGSKKILKWVLIGAFIGFFVIHPFVMVVGHLMMEPRLTHDHSIFEIVTSEILMSFSVKMMPWSLTFAAFGALISFFQGKGRNIRKALQISEERYRTLIDSSLTGVFIYQDEKYVFFNNKFAQIHGYKPEELMGRKYLELIHPDEREAAAEMVSKRLGGEPALEEYEIRRFRKDKKAIWCQVMATTIEYKGSLAILGNIIDITDRKRAEEDLKRTHDQLEETNKKLQFAYAQMRDWRDRLGSQLHGEEIGFLIDEKGQILGVTEKTMESTGLSRMELLRSNISDLVDEEDKYKVKDNIKKAWGGIFRKSFFNVIRKGSDYQEFETKFMRVSPEHGRMLLVLMRESYEDDQGNGMD